MACKDDNCVCKKNKTMKESETKNKKDILEELKENRDKNLEELKESIADYNPKALLADGHDHAILGYATTGQVIYSISMIIEGLMEMSEMTREEAIEFFDFNIAGAYVGEYTPIFMHEV